MLPIPTIPAPDTDIRTVLIVDDTPANLMVAADYLESHGFEVAVAQDGEECLERVQVVRPDIILLDVMMPGINGLETCQRLKTIDKIKDIPVIFMTALSDMEHKVAGFIAGGVDYVTKPFQIEEVLARINTHLALRAAQQKLSYSEQRFHDFAESASDWFWETDNECCLTHLSENFSKSQTAAGIISNALGKCWWELPHPRATKHMWDESRKLFEERVPFKDLVLQHIENDDQSLFVSLSGRPLFLENGQFHGYRGTGRDITKQMQADQIIRDSEARFRDLIELSSDWYWELDTNYRFTLLAGDVATRAGFDPRLGSGKTPWEIEGLELSDIEWDEFRALLAERKNFNGVTYFTHMPDGNKHYVNINGKPIFNVENNFSGYRGVGHDITERKRDEERIQHLAYHDSLTSLPNRRLFGELLNHGLAKARRYNKTLAILFIDLDRFKNINDTLGHHAGDLLLQEVAKTLKGCLRKNDTVARLGGDEFVVLVEEINDTNHVSTVASKILVALAKPFTLLGKEFRITASIGISVYPIDGQDEETLMKNADIGLYRAKEEGKNNFQLYSEQMNDHSVRRLTFESGLRGALERNEFVLHYQAKINLRTGAISGMEALIRWQHPTLGMVLPDQFIPIAEEAGLIMQIGRWVLQTACEQNKTWQDQGLPALRVSVNLSTRQFSDESLPRTIAEILRKTGLAADFLELEITESMVMRAPEKAAAVLTALKAMGICLTIDDFGVGYSSLATIKRFPIDVIKIDQSFIRDIPEDKGNKALTETIIVIGKNLNLTVVAEGVETQAQYDFLREKSCDEFQGFYFSKPIDKDKFFELLRDHPHKLNKSG